MERWSGRVAIVTGSSSGVGAAVAEKLAQFGVKVVGLDIAGTGTDDFGGHLHRRHCDVTKDEEVRAAIDWVDHTLGGVDILVNCAGLAPANTLTGCDAKTDVWRATLYVNVIGLSVCTREVIRSMRERGIDDGHVVHFGSIYGHAVSSHPSLIMYSASKHAVRALTEGLRRELVELHSKIKISSISPGFIYTPMVLNHFGRQVFDDNPYLYPQDVADAVAFVLGTPPHVQNTLASPQEHSDKRMTGHRFDTNHNNPDKPIELQILTHTRVIRALPNSCFPSLFVGT
uniref:Uncharacterized protein n=1 Tax=Timema bartmani TaxID=61472 RepID=A0A7R9F357_9NEOP|nr:unnamed protein product [Timema bartmani]